MSERSSRTPKSVSYEICWAESDSTCLNTNTNTKTEPTTTSTPTETEATSGFCNCALQLSETEAAVGPTPSDILYDTLIHHEAYDESEDHPVSDSSTNSTDSVNIEQKLSPFSAIWCTGFNPEVKVINLSTKFKQEIFFAASHKGIMYDYNQKTMVYIHGHVNRIVAAAIDHSGKWLATSDVGEGSTINITNTFERVTVHTIHNDENDKGATLLGLSPGGKYLVSIHGTDVAVIKFWLWTFGQDVPTDTYVCSERKMIGEPKKISFHPDEPEYIMIAFQRQVLFFKWDISAKKLIPPNPVTIKKAFGLINDCTLATRCHECFAATSGGYILIFGSATYTENFEDHPIDNAKSFIKCIKASEKSLIWLNEIDDYLVTITSIGTIIFYDKIVRLIYWVGSPSPSNVVHISFNTEERIFKFKDPFEFNNEFFTLSNPCIYLESSAEERAEEFEILYKNTVPSMCNLHSDAFVVRSYISTSHDGSVHLCDIVHQSNELLLFPVDSHVASIDCSNETNFLVIAYCNGRITLFDIDKLQFVTTNTTLMDRKSDYGGVLIQNTYIKYGPQAINLVLGTTQGEVWFLSPILKTSPEKMHRYSLKQIEQICLSYDENLCAFYDSARVMYIIKYSNHNWQLLTRMRSHCKPITDMLFTNKDPQQLFSIGCDGYLVEYNIVESTEMDLVIKSRIQIEQTCTPRCFLHFPPSRPDGDAYFLTTNEEQKYRMIKESGFMCRTLALGPAHGCYKTNSVRKIKCLPGNEDKYILFMNKNHIGIQKLPVDGNPYKYVGVIGNPNLKQFIVTDNGQYVFTCGYKDQCVFMWEVHSRSVDILHRLGGVDLEPYYCLIDGGANGWYFQEMQDLFCYMQIVHQGDSYQPQNIDDSLAISELPDLLRSCGYYPSNFEIENILNDIKYRDYETTGILKEKITFLEFVKLYINHKPAQGIRLEELQHKLKCLDTGGEIHREKFATFLCNYGEKFAQTAYDRTMQTLVRKLSLGSGSTDNEYSYLPKIINYENFTREILGVLQETVYEETQEKLRRERKSQ